MGLQKYGTGALVIYSSRGVQIQFKRDKRTHADIINNDSLIHIYFVFNIFQLCFENGRPDQLISIKFDLNDDELVSMYIYIVLNVSDNCSFDSKLSLSWINQYKTTKLKRNKSERAQMKTEIGRVLH